MLLLSVFLVAALLTFLGLRAWVPTKRFETEPRVEGLLLVGATLLSVAGGWIVFLIPFHEAGVGDRRQGCFLILLVAALYLATALRRRLNLPIWLADICVFIAAYLSLRAWHGEAIQVLSAPVSADTIGLGKWALPLTLLWMWAIARMTATMNRAPQVTGGYLGIVSLALLVLLELKSGVTPHFFASDAAAALAGAGLATVPLAIRRSKFDIGWPAALSMGFLLAQIATIGLLKSATFFMLLLSLIVFGLPLLDVSFFRLRAALRGEQLNVEEQRLRLHEALARRGIAPLKITLLYLVMGAWLCGLGVLTARFVFSSSAPPWVLLSRAIVVLLLFFIGFVLFFSLARVWMRRGEGEIIPEEIEAFGVRISPVSMAEALDKIEGFIRAGAPHHVVTSDANSILRAQEDEEYAAIVRRAALIAPDGFGVVWGARLLNLPIYERVTGVDLVTGICERAAERGYSIYILGSEPGIAATAAAKLAERYPGLRVAGTQHGFWKREGIADEEVVQRIHQAKPDVLFVAFGIPAQEKFIARHFEALNVPVSLGVGGSFDVYSEKLKRAPEYIQRSGLEWIYRVWQEPWRWKRMSYVPRFMAFALRTWIFGPRRTAHKPR
jgi:N-acetylglucosaminyldiphosphoundecaprenol N-acetyl-beta-D-mannosaminyltransferase